MNEKIIVWLCVLGIMYSCDSHRGKRVEGNPWSSYDVGRVEFKNLSPETDGAKLYAKIVPNPEQFIQECARQVLNTLYFSPKDSIPKIELITYILKSYNGISEKSGTPPAITIAYSTDWIEKSYKGNMEALILENRGVLWHELTHGFQLEPQGIGTYGTNKTFWAFIEGMADAVRYVNGGFTLADRPKGGHYMDGYRTTGFFLAWLMQTKDSDFLRKFNSSTLHVIPWSFKGAICYSLGEEYDIDTLWEEYLVAMGDK
ncbi:basic secretory protein-like protein [Butyricimonas paravirosa]